jgi:methionine aminotransferase
VNTPLQYALADFLNEGISVSAIKEKYESKRALVQEYLRQTRFGLVETKGTYFQLLNYNQISNKKDTEFVKDLISEYKLALFPLSFYYHDFLDNHVVGMNFAHPDDHLKKGLEILQKIGTQ